MEIFHTNNTWASRDGSHSLQNATEMSFIMTAGCDDAVITLDMQGGAYSMKSWNSNDLVKLAGFTFL